MQNLYHTWKKKKKIEQPAVPHPGKKKKVENRPASPTPRKEKKKGGSLVIDATIPPSPPLFSPQNEQIEFG